MHELEKNFGHKVIAARWWIILATVLLTALAGNGGRFLELTTDYRVFFSPDNPELKAFEALENVYSKNDNVMIVLAPKDGNVFSRETLAAVESLTEQAWQVPYSYRVDSLTNFQHTRADGDDLTVANLVEGARALSNAQLARVRDIALAEPLLVRRIVSASGAVTAVNVSVRLPGKNAARETPEVVSHVRALAAELRRSHPRIDVHVAGVVMLNNAFTESSLHDLRTLVPVSFTLMLVVLALLLRALTPTAATLLVIAFSIVFAMGLGGYLGIPVSSPSAVAPTIILTVAVANSVHVLVTFLHAMGAGKDKHDALVESLRLNLQPVFLASLTTAIGFLSMNFSEVPPFHDLGNLVAMGVGASFVLSVTFVPALMAVLPVRARRAAPAEERLMSAFGAFVVRRRGLLLWGMAAFVLLLIAFLPRNELNDIFLYYFDESTEFRQDSDFTIDNLTGLMPLEYSVESGEPGGISDPAFLRDLAAFARWFRQQPETKHVNTLTDILARLNRNMHGDDAAWQRLPEERELAAQYLLLYEMSLPYGLDLNNQINLDKSATRLTATLRTLSSNELIALEARARAWLEANAPAIKRAAGTGTALMFAHIGKRNIVSMLAGTTVALIMISLVLVVALRSFKMGLVSMVPNLVPPAMGFGLWGMLVGEVGLALSVVSGMTLGIVVDDTVHFISKYLRARRERGDSPEEAVRYAFRSVGWALAVTSIVLVAGFSVLSLSTFELNSGMGLLTAIVIAFALVADFLLLPPLLMRLEESTDVQMAPVERAPDSAAA